MTDTAPRDSWRIAYLAAALSVIVLGWHTVFEPFGRDQGIHATIAYAWGEGLTTYRDVYNIKPPLTTLMHRLSQMVFGANMQAIRLWDLGVVLLSVLGLVRAMQLMRRPRAEAALAGVGFALIYYALTYWEHAQTDGWAGMTVIASLLCLLRGWRAVRGRGWWMLAGGAALAVGVGFKYTVMASGLMVFAPLIAGGPALRFRWSDLGLYVLGGALVLGGIVLTLWIGGALTAFLEIQNYIRGYIAYGSQRPGLLREVMVILSPSPVVAWIVLAGLLPWLAALMRGESLFVAVTAIWGLTAFLSGHVQGKGFAYHFMPLIPVYAILSGMFMAALLTALTRRTGRPVLARGLIVLGLAWCLVSTPLWPRTARTLNLVLNDAPRRDIHAFQPMPPDFDVVATQDFARLMTAYRVPGDSLFVWGYETMLYLLAQEPPRYRYPYAWPFVVDFHDGRYSADLMDRLRADPPRHIVVQDGDATPWVTGRPQSSAEYLQLFPELKDFIEAGYEQVEATDRFRLLQRRD
ncbi:ArnT family glycosyltransferase [Pseudooceanicola onchidii]|uniref:ArnT family glycosyltransferase n=1 Tax=Pseudooceanicola onchidii TaxID=2562279 RepID=UPI0010AB462D|nr:glycosyltransferase family 39 protein [Pseudooceanicola onchidii]